MKIKVIFQYAFASTIDQNRKRFKDQTPKILHLYAFRVLKLGEEALGDPSLRKEFVLSDSGRGMGSRNRTTKGIPW